MPSGSLRRRVARVFSMPPREILDRVRQYATARADLHRYRTGHSFARSESLLESPGRFFFTPAEIPALVNELKRIVPGQANEIVVRAESICRHHFDLLGYEDLDYGADIDWHLDAVHGRRAPLKPWFKVRYLDFDEVGDSKVIWELNRHQHLVTLAKAYWITGEEKFVREIFAEWTSWHKRNPYPMGVNWASSLEVAFRSLSWTWTFFFLLECPLFTTELRRKWKDALSLNGRHLETYLSTYFSPNTHLLGEALALFFLGTLFPELQLAKRWQRRGWDILNSEAARQVRADGFYFEQSTYYHVYALDMFLHARILAGLNGIPIAPEFDRTLERMLQVLLLLCRAGIPQSIGDDDGGRLFDPLRNRAEHMLDPLATGSVLYRRGDFKFLAGAPREETLWLLGLKGLADFDSLPDSEPTLDSTALPDSGIYLMHEPSGQQLQIDAGPLGAGSGGHGHADALSVGLVRQGHNLLLDPGTFEYVGDSEERARLRCTRAHNSLEVDGLAQSDPSGPFSWSSFPHVKVEKWIVGREFDLFHATQDGYSRLPSPVLHHRWVFHARDSFWLVRDVAEGEGVHQLDVCWHVGPTLRPEHSSPFVFSNGRSDLAMLTPEGHTWSQSVGREYCSPAYGKRTGASVITFGAHTQLPMDFVTVVMAGEQGQLDLGQLTRNSDSTAAKISAYRYRNSGQEHAFFFAANRGSWKLDAWGSDADFLWWRLDRTRDQYTLVLCNGSYVDAGGRRVLTCGKTVSYAEVVSSAAKVELFSSDREGIVLEESLDRVWAERELTAPDGDQKRVGN
jgi:heparinase II/III-like protein